jgi:16S rRNA processing protein RimM
MPPSDWVIIARLVRTHGRRGEIVANILTDFPERFEQRRRLTLIAPEKLGSRPREMEVESHWFFRDQIVFKFVGIDSINDADPLRHYDVAIPASERAPLEDGSVYISDLIGCRLIDLNRGAADVGEIVDVDTASSNVMLLVVRRPGAVLKGKPTPEALVPFVKAYLERVDAAEKRVEMRLPEGLLEINAPMTEDERRAMQNDPAE